MKRSPSKRFPVQKKILRRINKSKEFSTSRSEKRFFEIPIYYMDEAAFEKIRQKDISTMLKIENRVSGTPEYKRDKDYLENHVHDKWDYQTIIGWIRISIENGEVKGRLYRSKKKKFKYAGESGKYSHKGLIFQTVPPQCETSEEYFKWLLEEVSAGLDSEFGEKYYADLESIINLSEFIDWKRLLGNRQ